VGGDARDGWTLEPATTWHAKQVASNGSFATRWTLTAPSGVATGTYPVSFTASYRYGKRLAQLRYRGSVLVLPPAPHGTVAVSDLTWVSATNGWGPVEKDMSNGETAAGDGHPITLRGKVYPKGLGVHAESDVTYYLGGNCTSLTTDVGIDDEKASSGGDVIFQVYADGAKVADSGVVLGSSPAKSLTANVTGASWLRLHVDPDGANTYDHADWAGPTLTCH